MWDHMNYHQTVRLIILICTILINKKYIKVISQFHLKKRQTYKIKDILKNYIPSPKYSILNEWSIKIYYTKTKQQQTEHKESQIL